MTFPSPPWRMTGQLWLDALVRTSRPGPGSATTERPAGTYGVALVDYQEGSPLTYGELLVARPVKVTDGPTAGKHVTVTDIWVDSEPSREGGRSLWAVPKGSPPSTGRPGDATARRPVSAAVPGHRRRVGSERTALVLPRVPFTGTTWQPRGRRVIGGRLADRQLARLPGARLLDVRPRRSSGWLVGARTLASFVMRDFRMTFG